MGMKCEFAEGVVIVSHRVCIEEVDMPYSKPGPGRVPQAIPVLHYHDDPPLTSDISCLQ